MRTCCTAQGALLSALQWPKWEGNPKKGDLCLCMADSLRCRAENTILPKQLFSSKNQLKKKKGSRVCAVQQAVHRGHQRLGLDRPRGPLRAPECGSARRHRYPLPPHPSAACRQHRRGNSPDAPEGTQATGTVTGLSRRHTWPQHKPVRRTGRSSLCRRVQSKVQNSTCKAKLTPKSKGQGRSHSSLEVFKAQNRTEMNKAASGLAEDGTAISFLNCPEGI